MFKSTLVLILAALVAVPETVTAACPANSMSSTYGGQLVCSCNYGYACASCSFSSCSGGSDTWGCSSAYAATGSSSSFQYLSYSSFNRNYDMCEDTSNHCGSPSRYTSAIRFRNCNTGSAPVGALCYSASCNSTSSSYYNGQCSSINYPTCSGSTIDISALASWIIIVIIVGACCVLALPIGICFCLGAACFAGAGSGGGSTTTIATTGQPAFNNPNSNVPEEKYNVPEDQQYPPQQQQPQYPPQQQAQYPPQQQAQYPPQQQGYPPQQQPQYPPQQQAQYPPQQQQWNSNA